MAQLSRTDYILSVTAGAVPLADDEEPKEVSNLILCFHIKRLIIVFQIVAEAPAEPELSLVGALVSAPDSVGGTVASVLVASAPDSVAEVSAPEVVSS